MLMRYLGEAPGHSEWLQGRINLEEVAREILSKKKFLEFLALRRGDGSDEDERSDSATTFDEEEDEAEEDASGKTSPSKLTLINSISSN